jgi:hypothetical protein
MRLLYNKALSVIDDEIIPEEFQSKQLLIIILILYLNAKSINSKIILKGIRSKKFSIQKKKPLFTHF